jgi:hypothetical protein
MTGPHHVAPVVAVLCAALLLVACSGSATSPQSPAGSASVASSPGPVERPRGPIAAVCDATEPGSDRPPDGALVIDANVVGDLSAKTKASPAGSTFWLAPGTHTLEPDEYAQITPKDGNVYLGAPGAVLDGRGVNRYAFVGTATNVTISHVTVRGFTPPQDQGVVNHDSGDGWVIEHNTIEENRGAGLMAGARQQVRGNCLRNNGQYGINAYQPGNGIVGLVLEGNEIVGNNTDDWETKNPGCGCTGGAKFWSVDKADIRGNWIHDNRGPGLWADTNNNDFLIEGNLIEDNDSEALFYETSYNLVLRENVLRRNAIVVGKDYAAKQDNFPIPAIYLSESGGEPRVPARTDRIEIYDNDFTENWSGITAWENADRFCNSPANTSTDSCTRLVDDPATCVQPAIADPPLYDDCRWKTQRVDIHDNTFTASGSGAGCADGYSGRMAVLSNYGTYPDWSPYKGDVIQTAITTAQQVQWRNNTYIGPWTFVVSAVDKTYSPAQWQANPINQDDASTFSSDDADGC